MHFEKCSFFWPTLTIANYLDTTVQCSAVGMFGFTYPVKLLADTIIFLLLL